MQVCHRALMMINIEVYVVGNDEADAESSWTFTDYDSAREYALDENKQYIYGQTIETEIYNWELVETNQNYVPPDEGQIDI